MERRCILRVMDAHGISADLRDSFVDHAVNFDLDDNGYLKKAELEEAAKAWNADTDDDSEEAETTDSEAPAEEDILQRKLLQKKHVLSVQHLVQLMQTHAQHVDFHLQICD